MPNIDVDYLIVGQGLAGSLLSYKIVASGASVMVYDDHHHACASKIAAGIINPVTGHRWNLTANFHEYLKVAKELYSEIEDTLGCKLLSTLKQTRLVKNEGQSNYFLKRLDQSVYRDLLTPSSNSYLKDAGFGFADVAQSYRFDTQGFIEKMFEWLALKNSIRQQPFNYKALEKHETGLVYQSIDGETVCAKKVVFCEGYHAIDNPWLQHLPFKLAKGSVLEITIEPLQDMDMRVPHDRLLNWGHWILSDHQHRVRLGSTYDWNDTSKQASKESQNKLLESLHNHSHFKARAIKHKTGVRPTTKLRQPFVGPLSNHAHAYCLNGLGSKGCLIAPHYVTMLQQHMVNDSPIPSEVTQWL